MNTNRKNQDSTTHFGYQDVTWEEKTRLVNEVFNHVADRYDVMNDLMSLGIHRLWKKIAIEISRVRRGQQVLDLAGGSGDLTIKLAERVGPTGSVTLTDLNLAMINTGRDRLINHGSLNNIHYVQSNAEELPFCDNTFDCITIAFGLRNVSQKENALRSMFRVLKPGGRLLVLEFSQPTINALKPLYDAYSFYILPVLGQLITGHSESYRYLAESIRMHPDQNALKQMIEEAGFEDCIYYNLSAGIVAIHKAYKY